MTEIVSYVEMDVPHCILTFGVSPCKAQLGFSDRDGPFATHFNESYGKRSGGLTGAADSKLATGSFWFQWSGTNLDLANQTLFCSTTAIDGSTTQFHIRVLSATSVLHIIGKNAAGTTILDISATTPLIPRKLYHVLYSFDLTDTAKRHLYVDDVSNLTVTTYTNDTIDFTNADWGYAALPSGTEQWGMPGDPSIGVGAEFWFNPGTYLDFSITANRRLFREATDNRPVYLGATGQIPTGTAPLVFFGNPWQTVYTNLGTGGGFTNVFVTQEFAKFATGTTKCFNTLGTCQDLIDFANKPNTVIFSEDVRLDQAKKAPPNAEITTTTITATGAGTYSVPADVSSITIEAWGAGGGGGGTTSTTRSGGGGGGYSRAIINVIPSQTIYYQVGVGGTAGATGAGGNGGVSWINPAANSQPTGIGVVATGGSGGNNGLAAAGDGSLGTINRHGGISGQSNATIGGGGGGGAGYGADGHDGLANVAGAGGSPDGGAGANGVNAGPAGNGIQPGGGGGGARASGNGGAGGAGQVKFSTGFVDRSADAYPFIKSIDFQAAILSLGENMGQRATMDVTFNDSKHPDLGILADPYPTFRTYAQSTTYERGTFWGKFRARNRTLRGQPIRLIRGSTEQAINEMETRLFIIDSIDGPKQDGEFSIIAKDMLSKIEQNRALIPRPNTGVLKADLDTNEINSPALSPRGVGAEYPTSGRIIIGGSEYCAFTREGDVLTLSLRVQLGTPIEAHPAGTRVQYVYRNDAILADVLFDVLHNYAGIDALYLPLNDWRAETAGFMGSATLYPDIFDPMPVSDFISQLLEQTGAALWWDDQNELLRLQLLRPVATTAQRFNEDNVLVDTLRITEQPEKRISQVVVHYNRSLGIGGIFDASTYENLESIIDTDSELQEGKSIKTILGWAIHDKDLAVALCQNIISRYVKAPRRFEFEVQRFTTALEPSLGAGGFLGGGDPKVASWRFFDETGERIDVPIQITRDNPEGNRHILEAEEMLFQQTAAPVTDKIVVFDFNETNVNLLDRFVQLFGAQPVSGETLTAIINEGTIIGSDDATVPAFDIGTWPAGVTITLAVHGRIEGKGGNGRRYQNFDSQAYNGGVALYSRKAISLILNAGSAQIWGGGGGGAGGTEAGGGGGAGYFTGDGGYGKRSSNRGSPGTTEEGGLAGTGTGTAAANGGGPGVNGGTTSYGTGGTAGSGIDGVSFCTKTGTGDIRGSQVN